MVSKFRYGQILAVKWEFLLGTQSHSLHAMHELAHAIEFVSIFSRKLI